MIPHLAPVRTGTPAGGHGRNRGPAVIAAVIRREWMAVLALASALFASLVVLISVMPQERLWGAFAACGYAAAAAAAVTVRRWRAEATTLTGLAGGLLAPLAWMASAGIAAPEVPVIIRSARLFVQRGVPYQGTAALASAHSPYVYDPYLPLITSFGLPRALAGGGLLTDPRLWFALVFVITFGAALVIAGVRHAGWWTVAITASPVAAFPLSIGGDDLPMVGLMCLGLALLGRGAAGRGPRPVAAGIVFGVAAAMKATAWPALAVALLLVAARHGRRATAAFSLAAFGIAALIVGSAAAAQPHAMLANTILFPLGLTRIKSPAASVLPGYLIASTGSTGHLIAVALLVTAGAAVGAWLLIRPPRDERAAGWRLVLGLTLMIALAPATRVGYAVYPLGLSLWLLLAGGRDGWLARHSRWLSPPAPGYSGDPAGGTASIRAVSPASSRRSTGRTVRSWRT